MNIVIAIDKQIKELKDLREEVCTTINKSISELLKLRAKALEVEISES